LESHSSGILIFNAKSMSTKKCISMESSTPEELLCDVSHEWASAGRAEKTIVGVLNIQQLQANRDGVSDAAFRWKNLEHAMHGTKAIIILQSADIR
jgi:hypothetical protein